MPRLLRPTDQSQTHGQGKKTKRRPAGRQGQRRRMYRMGSGAAAESARRPAAQEQAERRRARAAPRLVSGRGSGDGCTGNRDP